MLWWMWPLCSTYPHTKIKYSALHYKTHPLKFYRLDTERSTSTGGAGLGLAIAQEIVTAHDGTISVESNPENTTFTVKLPL
ncbi:MAG: ATP-binding protein [Syntrophomonadaceae bacterium]|nr:ATP-binding protein [Syntrophomonadaceae bacterium]